MENLNFKLSFKVAKEIGLEPALILRLVEDNDGISIGEIGVACSFLSKRRIVRHLGRLEDKGYIINDGELWLKNQN